MTVLPAPSRRRRRLLLAVLVFLLALGAFVGYALYFTPSIQQRFGQIQVGMTLDQVAEILGRPPDLTSRIKGRIENDFAFAANHDPPAEVRDHYKLFNHNQWNHSELTIIAVTDDNGAVVCRYSSGGNLAPWYQRVLDLVKRGLHLR